MVLFLLIVLFGFIKIKSVKISNKNTFADGNVLCQRIHTKLYASILHYRTTTDCRLTCDLLYFIVREWVSDCSLTPIQQCSPILCREQVNIQWDDDKVRFCNRPTRWVGFFIVLAHWNNSPRVDMSLHSNTLFWFRANQSLLFLLNAACLAEKQQISIV